MGANTTIVKFRSSIKDLVGECVYGFSSIKKVSGIETNLYPVIDLHYSGVILCVIEELADKKIEAELSPNTKGYIFKQIESSFMFMPAELYIGFTQEQLISSTKQALGDLKIPEQIWKTNEGIHVRIQI